MRYATGEENGNRGRDATLDAIDAEEGFGLPDQNRLKSDDLGAFISSFRFADIGNQDENATEATAPTGTDKIDVTGEPPVVRSETGAVTPGSLLTLVGPASKRNIMSMNARIAYVMENGEPFCNHCDTNYFPSTRLACTGCGCGMPNEPHNGQDGLPHDGVVDRNFENVEGQTVADEVGNRGIIKEESNRNFVDMAIHAFKKEANDSELYYEGYYDAMNGKPLDEDKALLSKDYYNGYVLYKFYNKTPQESVGQKLFDIKPNSNSIPRSHEMSQMTPGDADRGPLELTDGFGHATASRKSINFPVDVIQNFFEI